MGWPAWADACICIGGFLAAAVPLGILFGVDALSNPSTVLLVLALPIALYYRVCMYIPLIGGIHRVEPQTKWPEAFSDSKVSLIIPAYNEAACIAKCVESILQAVESDTAKVEVVIVDDRSSDDTWTILQKFKAENHLDDTRLCLVSGKERAQREDGNAWKGKNWAVHQGSQHATGDILIFMDSDLLLRPGAIRSLVWKMDDYKADWLTVCSFSKFEHFHATLFCLPLFMGMKDALVVQKVDSGKFPYAFGQLNIIKRAAYTQLGGHYAVGHLMAESHELAKRARQIDGFRLRCVHGYNQATLYWYSSARECWKGMLKSVSARVSVLSVANKIMSVAPLFVLILLAAVGPWVLLVVESARIAINQGDDDAVLLAVVNVGLCCAHLFLIYIQRLIGWFTCGYTTWGWWFDPIGHLYILAMFLHAATHAEAKWGPSQVVPVDCNGHPVVPKK